MRNWWCADRRPPRQTFRKRMTARATDPGKRLRTRSCTAAAAPAGHARSPPDARPPARFHRGAPRSRRQRGGCHGLSRGRRGVGIQQTRARAASSGARGVLHRPIPCPLPGGGARIWIGQQVRRQAGPFQALHPRGSEEIEQDARLAGEPVVAWIGEEVGAGCCMGVSVRNSCARARPSPVPSHRPPRRRPA